MDEESSYNNPTSSGSDTVRPLAHNNPLSSHSNKEDLDEVLGLDGTIENDSPESDSDVEEHCDLTEKLAKWTVENNCTQSSMNQLLQILRESGHILSKDFIQRTLLQTSQVIITEDKCNGTYEGTINTFLQSLRFVTYQSNSICGWVSLFISSPQQFWTILVSVKPNPLNDFFSRFH